MLLSRHRDAEIFLRGRQHLGFEFVRGSTNRGGVAALRQLLARAGSMHLTITPDGRAARAASWPRGRFTWPRSGPAAGADGFRLRPAVAGQELGPVRHSAAVFAGPGRDQREICIPADLDRAGLEHRAGHRAAVESAHRRGRILGRLGPPPPQDKAPLPGEEQCHERLPKQCNALEPLQKLSHAKAPNREGTVPLQAQ